MKKIDQAIKKYGLNSIKKLTKEELEKVLENLKDDYCYLGTVTLNGLEGKWVKMIRKKGEGGLKEDDSNIFYVSNKPANLGETKEN